MSLCHVISLWPWQPDHCNEPCTWTSPRDTPTTFLFPLASSLTLRCNLSLKRFCFPFVFTVGKGTRCYLVQSKKKHCLILVGCLTITRIRLAGPYTRSTDTGLDPSDPHLFSVSSYIHFLTVFLPWQLLPDSPTPSRQDNLTMLFVSR
jgi:hypothetical protein